MHAEKTQAAPAGVPGVPLLGDELVVKATRERVHTRPHRRERWATLVMSGGLLAVAAVMATIGLRHGSPSWVAVAAYVIAYAIALSVEFELAHGSAVPTELVLVPMLFAFNPYLAPACVAAGLAAGALLDLARRRVHGERILILPASAWHAVGPAIVIATLAPGPPSSRHWAVYLLALASQFVFDFGSTAVRHALALGTGPRSLVQPMLAVFVVDLALAPVAMLAALEVGRSSAAPLLLVPLVVLLALLASDRRERIDRSIKLGDAYAGASEAARTDPLTGVKNRLAWEEAIAEVSSVEGDAAQALTVVLVDVDELKTANDSHGHDFGDRVLSATARAIESAVRAGDLLARIGGDEFAVLAAGLEPVDAAELEHRIREAVTDRVGAGGLRLRASVGSASVPPSPSLDEALLAADSALYAEKARRLSAA
jgi:diguanylate cyclase (GGDEF)-like protein